MSEARIEYPAVSAASFWPPHRLVSSGWIEHAPFAAWLIDAMRPATVVELGTHNGYSLLAMAAAARRSGLPTRFWAVDSWEGDDQAGFYAADVYETLRDEVAKEFPENVELVRSYFADAVDRFADGSIDLLHIDGRHGYEDVTTDWELYRSKLSSTGVAIFHDTREFQPGFEVHRFWDEIGRERGFTFEHGHGLGVLPVGESVATPVMDVIELARAHPERVLPLYAELGARWSRQWEFDESLHAAVAEANASAAAATAGTRAAEGARDALVRDVEERDREITTLHHEIAELHDSTSWKVTAPFRWVTSRLSNRS